MKSGNLSWKLFKMTLFDPYLTLCDLIRKKYPDGTNDILLKSEIGHADILTRTWWYFEARLGIGSEQVLPVVHSRTFNFIPLIDRHHHKINPNSIKIGSKYRFGGILEGKPVTSTSQKGFWRLNDEIDWNLFQWMISIYHLEINYRHHCCIKTNSYEKWWKLNYEFLEATLENEK